MVGSGTQGLTHAVCPWTTPGLLYILKDGGQKKKKERTEVTIQTIPGLPQMWHLFLITSKDELRKILNHNNSRKHFSHLPNLFQKENAISTEQICKNPFQNITTDTDQDVHQQSLLCSQNRGSFSLKEEGECGSRDPDKPWGHHAKLNRPDTKVGISSCSSRSRQDDIQTEWLSRIGGREKQGSGYWSIGIIWLSLREETVLEMAGGVGTQPSGKLHT